MKTTTRKPKQTTTDRVTSAQVRAQAADPKLSERERKNLLALADVLAMSE